MAMKVLVIDDEPQIRRFLRATLTAHGHEVDEAATAAEGIKLCVSHPPDIVVLDLGLPDRDGTEVIGDLRAWTQVPLIVLSARESEREKIKAFELGANDYVTKPFGMGELLARMQRLVKDLRTTGAGNEEEDGILRVQDIELDPGRRSVHVSGRRVKLTKKEFEVLLQLMQSPDRVLTHQQILERVWGPAHVEEVQYLRIYIGNLRQKLGDESSDPRYIVTEPQVGYRLLAS